MSIQNSQLEKLVESVQASSRYREISDELIRDIGSRELAKRSSFKEAVKAAKRKLHQVGGVYLTENKAYDTWLNDLQRLAGSRDELLPCLQMMMSHHASTRERLPILEQFYTTILTDLPPVHSVLDIACGLNPLALPWMPFANPVEYYACDIYKDMIRFLNQYMALMQVQGKAQVCDVLQSCPTRQVDVAFVLKTLPCLEQVDKTAGLRLLQTLQAKVIVVSFPVHSLGGKAKGMEAYYAARFRALLEASPWPLKQYEFATELVFVIKKQDTTAS